MQGCFQGSCVVCAQAHRHVEARGQLQVSSSGVLSASVETGSLREVTVLG